MTNRIESNRIEQNRTKEKKTRHSSSDVVTISKTETAEMSTTASHNSEPFSSLVFISNLVFLRVLVYYLSEETTTNNNNNNNIASSCTVQVLQSRIW
mmetsp:Transcript_13508/g.31598  ORF Transcript_13508/g.31598 Transcript_13508/m.31598 type:complete len:97 (-) Transcript_13508:3097-3387(-)